MSFHSVNETWARNDSVCTMLPCVGPLTGLGVDFHLFWAVYFVLRFCFFFFFLWSDRSFMVDPLGYFPFQPVLHDLCNKGCGMCSPVRGMVHTKEPLLLIEKRNKKLTHYFQSSDKQAPFLLRASPCKTFKHYVMVASMVYFKAPSKRRLN